MGLASGSRIGPYEVVGPLGAGGMGEVYRARDARLQRDVALKVLPEAFAADPERLARFEREAQALAALKHPNIATIYGIEDGPAEAGHSSRALVLELVEGETLEERLARGAIPVDEATGIARQIAAALEGAHEQGIVHRDLKPANIKLTPDGSVKVLDFGLAKLADSGASGSSRDELMTMSPTMSPTIASPAMMTGVNVILGTAAYMAPEQARGKVVDRRADIWAFGVILYEMLTGTRAFAGDSVTEVAGAVIHKELDLRALPAETPANVRMALRQCLQKDAKKRIRDIGDVALLLDGTMALPVAATAPAAVPARRTPLYAGAAAIIGALVAATAVWFSRSPAPAPSQIARFDVPRPGPGALSSFLPIGELSPDGRTLAYLALSPEGGPRLYLRSIDNPAPRMVNEVEFKRQAGTLFWSPDSRSLGVWTDGVLKRVDVAGGPALKIADVANFTGGTWNRDGVIVYADRMRGGLFRASASGGGPPVALTTVDTARKETAHFLPSFLPDGVHFLYMRGSTDNEVGGVYVGQIDRTPEQQDLTRLIAYAGSQPTFVSLDGTVRGYLLYVRGGILTAHPFDAGSRQFTGDPMSLIEERVVVAGGYGAFSASATGALTYVAARPPTGTLVSATRTGVTTPLSSATAAARAFYPRLSPDGRRLALVLDDEIWVYDLDGRPPVKVTFDGNALSPMWSPDGTRIFFELAQARDGIRLFSVPADGSGAAPQPAAPPGHFHPHGWSGGRLIAAAINDTVDLVMFEPRRDATPMVVLDGPNDEGIGGAVSPDGRWLAYTSDVTGRAEVWARPLQGTGAAIRLSPNGGTEPVWSRDGRELYYLQNDMLMAMTVQAQTTFGFRPPVELFSLGALSGQQPPNYDVGPDGRFVFVKSDDLPATPISIVLNWPEILRGRTAAQ